jgi:hypothetical protein
MMADQTPVTPMGTGKGEPAHVSLTVFLGFIIPLIASSIIMPMWNAWLASQHETNRAADAQKILTNQAENKDELTQVKTEQAKVAEKAESTAAKVEEIHQTTSAIAGALPPSPEKTSDKLE